MVNRRGVCVLTCVVVSGLFAFIDAQIGLNGCIDGWTLWNKHCYGFISDRRLILEEADSYCWTHGSRLLTVNNLAEHEMVASWLKDNDVVLQSTWFIGGYYTIDTVNWDTGDVITDAITPDLWNIAPNLISDLYSRIAYAYGNKHTAYGWTLVSGSRHANFICEMSQIDVQFTDVMNRDYDYGHGGLNRQEIPRGPFMTLEPRNVAVIGEGTETSIALECSASGNPPPGYTWYRGNTTITTEQSKRYTVSGGRLIIQGPRDSEDAGMYHCKAANSLGTVLSRTAVVQFGYLHAFSPVKSDDQVGTVFEGVRISCFTPAYNPEVRYGWFQDHNTHNYIFPNHPVHFISQSGYLYFSEVQPTDDRTYYCVVTLVAPHDYDADTTMSPSRVGLGTKLILRPGKTSNNYGPIIYTHTFPTPALRGSLVRLECVAYGSLPLMYSWSRADGQPFVKGTQLSDINRVLTIANAPLEADGDYICKVVRQGKVSKTVTISLFLETKPYFSDPINNMFVDAGQTVVWRCKAVARPRASFSWYKDGVLLTHVPGKLEVSGNKLTISNVAAGDSGMYQCAATNRHGTSFSSGELQILDGVVIERGPEPTEVAVNETQFLSCFVDVARSDIDVKYRWKFNGHYIDFKRHHHFISGMKEGASGLYIREAQYAHEGEYTCEAQTPLQVDTRTAKVTVRGPPGAPAGVYVDGETVTSFSARVIWTMTSSMEHGAPILSYDIEAETFYDPGNWTIVARDVSESTAVATAKNNGNRSDQRSTNLTGLVPNTNYRFKVRAVNAFGRGSESCRPSAYIHTPSAPPYRAPHSVGGGDGKVGTLNMSWTPIPESEHCGPGLGYTLYWKRQSTRERYDWHKVVLLGHVGMYSAQVGVENYYLGYDVMVGVFDDLGAGPNSSVVTVFSAMGMPDNVPKITSVSGVNLSSVLVTWDPIPDDREHIKGSIGGYTIQYYWNNLGCSPLKGCAVTNLRNRNIYGQASDVLLIDLEINSEFFFRLQVFNSAGRGPKGEWRRGETANNAPINYPRFVTVTSHGPNSVLVTWQGIMTTKNEEIITGYKVKWWLVQSDIRHANETTTELLDTSAVLNRLQQESVYQLRVLGVSAGGDGAMSDSVFFTLKGGMIQIDPATTEICYEGVSCGAVPLCLGADIRTLMLITILVMRRLVTP
ncbi:contactin-like [Dreissena polymorpha]|uniref:contactin-like n=1 Tax=Dreissena polymorpha TaxID=45954 RepID=UPI0022645D3E|nr:contactin-like [Dreissena polymorpha]